MASWAYQTEPYHHEIILKISRFVTDMSNSYTVTLERLSYRYNFYRMTFISPKLRKLIPYFTLLFVSGYIFSDNFLRFIEFHSDVKVKQIKPVISGESDEETVTPRFPNLMICSFQRVV